MKTATMLAVVAMFALGACNTVKGMGQDVSDAGQSVEHTANKVESDM